MSVFGVTVARHGETIDFGDLGKVKASLKASTKATYSLANRAYYIEGQCFRTSPDMFAEGDYFTRENDSGKYFVSTVQSEPLAADLVYLYGIRCNAVISLHRCKGYANGFGDIKREWETVAEEIYCFRDFVDRSGKTTNDGLINQAIYTLIIPQKYRISDGNRVVMKHNSDGKFKDVSFRVESVGTALADYEGISGVNTVQMSLDLRG